MPSANDVARCIEDRLGSLGAYKLQKLLYYTQAWSLAYCGRLVDEKNFWLLYALEYVSPVVESEVRALIVVTDPPVPLD